jgi:hypothetical protein
MKDRGQVFTLDMLFALILVAAVVSVSGQAFELASEQARSYSTRYSLERVTNDAADVLIKTVGIPPNWEDNIETLETPGLTENATYNENIAVPNIIDFEKFTIFRDLLRTDNWDPTKDEVQAVRKLFGDTDNFEIKVIHTEEDGEEVTFWDIWPGWDTEDSSGVEDALEVSVVRRLVVAEYLTLGRLHLAIEVMVWR